MGTTHSRVAFSSNVRKVRDYLTGLQRLVFRLGSCGALHVELEAFSQQKSCS